MAANIIKWWKHKILQGYNKLSVLQECPTDCEDLIHDNRASCSSAPPDLLHHNIYSGSSSEKEKDIKTDYNETKITTNSESPSPIRSLKSLTDNNFSQNELKSVQNIEKKLRDVNYERSKHEIKSKEIQEKITTKAKSRMHLEEFTCDVSVNSEGNQPPLQFSFTFYDLDGYHNKITKDDITGIVYTIYDSIGKNLIVPHYGSKTINVRLTVSPESKTSGRLKKTRSAGANNRRPNRWRPKKLIKTDNEDEETDFSDKSDFKKKKSPKIKSEHLNMKSKKFEEELYDNFSKQLNVNKRCNESIYVVPKENTKAKILRKARKQKPLQQQTRESRQRSLSLGNESRWNNKKLVEDRKDSKSTPTTSGKCYNTIKREELIDIIRESMEKNRLCFQSKPQATVSPIRHRSNTVSKIDSEKLKKHYENHDQQQHHHHGSHHIPIYHQQLPINPVILQTIQNSINTGLEKQQKQNMNLCGYDSILHEKICNSNVQKSSPTHLVPQSIPVTSSPVYQTISQTFSPKTNVQNSKHLQQKINYKRYHKKINTNYIEITPENGYNLLPSTPTSTSTNILSTQKLNINLLNTLNPELTIEEKLTRTIDWLNNKDNERDGTKCNKKDAKNYDNLLYAKLNEKLLAHQQVTDKSGEKSSENNRDGKRNADNNSEFSNKENEMIKCNEKFCHLSHADSIECENLINESSDNDTIMSQTTSENNPRFPQKNSQIFVHEHFHHHYYHY